MKTAIINIPMAPMAKQSVRFGNGGAYKAHKYRRFERDFMIIAKTQCKQKFSVFAMIEIVYTFKERKAWPKKNTRLLWDRDRQAKEGMFIIDETEYKTSRPDVHDNLNKMPVDCLSKAGILSDDSIIVQSNSVKIWGASNSIKIKITGQ